MRNSFLAIIGRFGLESLVPECKEGYCLFLRVIDERPAACFWTVMERGQAMAIHDLLGAGEGQWALDELALSAEFMGPLSGIASGNRRVTAP